MPNVKGLVFGMLAGIIVHFLSLAAGREVTIGGSLLACAWAASAFSEKKILKGG
ncbi:MAG: hypothetical protein ACOZAL_03520 [Patescibacteria group bacterium]